MIYQSKPQQVEAIQWTGENFDELLLFAPEKVAVHTPDAEIPGSVLELLAGVRGDNGWVRVPVGYWLVHKPDDLTDIWPVEPVTFTERDEPTE